MRDNVGLDMATEAEARAAAIIADLDAGHMPNVRLHIETPAFAEPVAGEVEEVRETVAGDRDSSKDMTFPGGTSFGVAPPDDKWHDPNDPSRRS